MYTQYMLKNIKKNSDEIFNFYSRKKISIYYMGISFHNGQNSLQVHYSYFAPSGRIAARGYFAGSGKIATAFILCTFIKPKGLILCQMKL